MRRLCFTIAAALVGCGPKPATSPKTQPPSTQTDAASARPPTIDGARLFSVVEHLASDALGGRYTLSADIRTSADYLAAQLKASGVAPVGSTYAHEFALVTGAEPTTPPTLAIASGTKRAEIDPTAFVPLSGSASGSIDAEVVFVGYAAQAEAGSQDGSAAYDDLAGVDVKGKVALVLLHQPGQPDVRAFWRTMGKERRAFEAKAEPLREKGDTKALGKLKKKSVEAIAKLATPWLGGATMSAEDIAAFSDPATPLDVEGIGGKLTQLGRSREGVPQFTGFSRTDDKVKRLVEAGASAVILVHGPRSFVDPQARDEDELPSLNNDGPINRTYAVPVVRMKWKEADKHFKIGGKRLSGVQAKIDTKLVPQSGPTGRTAKLDVQLRHVKQNAPNVLATIPGTDLAHEVVVFGAHYDHIGRNAEGEGECHERKRDDGSADGICNGADDNASGTAIVVELARALAEAGYKPRRSLVFALFSGEEMGLLGSKAFAETQPKVAPFDKGKIVAMVNIDMVGRLRDEGLAIGGVASSAGWMQILDDVGNHGMPITYDRAITTRSDHAAFYEKQIPVLFFFTHTHPDYHGPGDESDRINREGMVDIAKLVVGIGTRLGDGHAIAFAPPKNAEEGLVRALPGDNPKTIEKRVAADGKVAPAKESASAGAIAP